MQAFSRIDTHTGDAQTWFPGRRCFCEELIFVAGPNGDTQEDDGYLLGMVYDAAKHKSYLAVSPLSLCHAAHSTGCSCTSTLL